MTFEAVVTWNGFPTDDHETHVVFLRSCVDVFAHGLDDTTTRLQNIAVSLDDVLTNAIDRELFTIGFGASKIPSCT